MSVPRCQVAALLRPTSCVLLLCSVCTWGAALVLPAPGVAFTRLLQPFSPQTIDENITELQGCEGFSCVERYVRIPDKVYSWTAVGQPQKGTNRGISWTSYTVNLRSLQWMPKLTNRQYWQHTLTVVVPEKLTNSSPQAGWANLFVDEQPWLAHDMAARTGIISVSLGNVPNQAIDFVNDLKGPINEEELKALGWLQYSRIPEHPEWPIEMPTVKSVVRAMDAVQEFVKSHERKMPLVHRFIVSGHSKRAIATFMAGAVDNRVAAMMPLGHALNLNAQGLDSFENINNVVLAALIYDQVGTQHIKGKPLELLQGIIDPYFYREKLTVPKLVMLCGGDDFFAPDCTRSWWSNLPGKNLLYMFGNCPHESYQNPEDLLNMGLKLTGTLPDFVDAADAFVNALVLNHSMPELTWDIGEDGAITAHVISEHNPTSVELWTAHSLVPGIRDFRRINFRRSPLGPTPSTTGRKWKAMVSMNFGYTAFYIEFKFAPTTPGATAWRLTTEVSVVPTRRPFKPAPTHDRANYLYR